MEDLKFEGSFSFAGSDFMNSSTFALFSDHEDEHGENDEYIEIALDHHKSTVDDDEEGDLHELDYLRISFSSTTVPFPEFPDHVNSSAADVTLYETPSSSSSSSSLAFTADSSSSTATTFKDALLGSESESGRFHKTGRRRSSHMPRILDPPSSETGKRNENSHNGDLLRNRKASKMRAASATNGGMMMKLLIKIRGIKLGTLFASFLKPRGNEVVVGHRENIVNHTTTTDTNNRTSESAEYYRRLFMKPLVKWLIQRNTDNDTTTKPAAAGVGGDPKYSKLMNINGAMSGVLRAMGFSTKLDNNITNNSKSCPTSINSSSVVLHHHNNGSPTTTKPDHLNKMYTRDNSISIQAAIAHCKTSFST